MTKINAKEAILFSMNDVLKYEKKFSFFCNVILFKFNLTLYELFISGLIKLLIFFHTLSILMI